MNFSGVGTGGRGRGFGFGPFDGEVFEFFHEHRGLDKFDIGKGRRPFDVSVRDDDAVIVLLVAEETGYRHVVAVHYSVEYILCLFKVFSFQSSLRIHDQLLLK